MSLLVAHGRPLLGVVLCLDFGPISWLCLPRNSTLTAIGNNMCFTGTVSKEFCSQQSHEVGDNKLKPCIRCHSGRLPFPPFWESMPLRTFRLPKWQTTLVGCISQLCSVQWVIVNTNIFTILLFKGTGVDFTKSYD